MTASPPADAEAACVACVHRYIDALNRGDTQGVRDAYHFPHVLIGGGEVVLWEQPSGFTLDNFHGRVAKDGWTRSSFDGHKVVLSGPSKLHVDVWFTRWRGDGSAIGVHHSLYVFTLKDGRWGLQARSSYG